jgi:hypothetical protein
MVSFRITFSLSFANCSHDDCMEHLQDLFAGTAAVRIVNLSDNYRKARRKKLSNIQTPFEQRKSPPGKTGGP